MSTSILELFKGTDRMEALTLFDPASAALGPTLFWQQPETKQTVLEFFAARIRNPNTRAAYLEALKQFAEWAAVLGKEITDLNAVDVACYVENHLGSLPTVKQHLSAVKRFLDFLTTRGHLPFNPALSVKAPRFADTQGKTAFLADEEPQQLLSAIDTSTLAGLRDRALIAAMLYTFARVSAVTNMRVEDYALRGKKWWFTLHEKGGKRHRVPANHKLEEAMDAYLAMAGIGSQGDSPLFRRIHGPSDTSSAGHHKASSVHDGAAKVCGGGTSRCIWVSFVSSDRDHSFSQKRREPRKSPTNCRACLKFNNKTL
jgi:site-specific recombinase XerC